MGATTTPLSSTFNIKSESKEEFDLQNEILPSSENSNKNFRSELLKTAILVGVFIFSLIILKKYLMKIVLLQLLKMALFSTRVFLLFQMKS